MNHIDLKNKTVFITGSAGFIGSNLVLELLRTQSPINIIGLDKLVCVTRLAIRMLISSQI